MKNSTMDRPGPQARVLLKRRALLKRAALIGCSVAAQPLLAPITLAATPGDARLVVLILRGGMDGLDVLQPTGDRHYAHVRPTLRSPARPLTDFYALNDGLADMRPLWDAGELAFVQATATPYRDKRSHFEGQDLLEAGTGADVLINGVKDGWLNRLLQTMPGATGETAYAIGQGEMKILSGKARAANWSPRTKMTLGEEQRRLFERIYMDDPLFHAAAMEAMELADSVEAGERSGDDRSMAMDRMPNAKRSRAQRELAKFAVARLNRETRIAAFSLGGWDTHRGQTYLLGVMLNRLADTILTLKTGLGPNWDRTTVLAMTEFGRSVRENGNGGTDHGTGGMMVLAGGAIRGGRVYGDWPGLAPGALYADRDLTPTADVRAYAGWALASLFGADRNSLETKIFPGLDLGADPRFMR